MLVNLRARIMRRGLLPWRDSVKVAQYEVLG
jgi:hypothetical protein